MSLILNIDTSTELAVISLAEDGRLVNTVSNDNQKDHAAFLQPAIKTLLKKSSFNVQQLDAVAVASGPGSYTGLRVSMASAKGLCYALNKPLIAIGTLELMAATAIATLPTLGIFEKIRDQGLPILLCPMIDARRLEVFTAMYNKDREITKPPAALILDENCFNGELFHHSVIFFGNGSPKWLTMCGNINAYFAHIPVSHDIFSVLSFELYQQKSYISLAYSEPFYLKAFQSTEKKQAT